MSTIFPYPGRIVKSGEKNSQIVVSIQQRLNELKCSESLLSVDGSFGLKTARAVKVFQSRAVDIRQIPLKLDGQIGPITWAALFGEETPSIQPDSNLLQEAIKFATSQVGIMENPLFSNQGPEVNQYLASVALGPGYAWCAAFLHWCFDQAANHLNVTNPVVPTASVLDHWTKAGKAGTKRIFAVKAVNDPTLVKPGQIFTITFGGGFGHTGLVTSVDNGIIHTIEGNSKPDGGLIREGYGVFRRKRKVFNINLGYIDYT
ncbi:hypothetical protein GCM10028803_46460 [Larkinella knui]|uniref:Peptidoglycan-binding protein n=1 Tax=Larkinella knui TaxID=2025310 RepID=A0A3P1CPR3_9BACT|nr:peptidoglycan-binding protein [Larkinella knui]RRB15239.1 peptidoglycan-binding protein [Larkinella knui]